MHKVHIWREHRKSINLYILRLVTVKLRVKIALVMVAVISTAVVVVIRGISDTNRNRKP